MDTLSLLLLFALATPAPDLSSTLGTLCALDVAEEQTAVPDAAALLMRNAKHDLRDLASRALRAQPADARRAAANARLVILMSLVKEGIGECPGQYGTLLSFDVVSPPGHDDLVAVTFDLSIPCGSDSVLYLFRFDSEWRLVFERSENDYDTVSSALGSFDWTVSRPDANGAFLVVTASISPWCISNWQNLTYTADRIEPYSDAPLPIDRGTSSIYLSGELELSATPDRYSLRFAAEFGFEGGMTRIHRRVYRVEHDRPLRIDPIAESAEDFLDEWLSMPDDDAARWSEVPKPPIDIREWSYVATTKCVDALWQVRVDDENDTPLYFVVSERDGVYRLITVTRAACAASPPLPEPPRDRS